MTTGNSNGEDTRALYRKYRSKTLSEVVGQRHITDVLSRAIAKGKVAHAYLLTGPRGVGKTSVARILAHEINGLPYDETTQHPDIIEIDAASNRRIDDIRDLRDKVQIAPTSANYKVYIIDEVHMLTGESFNAFLKTLEEPPEHVVFILATTDVHKLPVTITSRTQRYTFRSITADDALAHLRMIADSEQIAIEDEGLRLVAQHGDGSFRDSISLLDQLSSLSDPAHPITAAQIEQLLGRAPKKTVEMLLEAYLAHDHRAIITQLDALASQGVATTAIVSGLLDEIRQQITGAPALLPLLDSIADVMKSARPDMKLLSILLASTPAPVRHVTASATTSTPLELRPLENEATKPRPSETAVAPPARRAATNVAKKATPRQAAPAAPPEPERVPPVAPKESQPFDFGVYITHLKEHHIALSSILAKCTPEYTDETLTLYTGTPFWKKKLDTVKYQPILHDALVELGMGSPSIETIPTPPPIKDSQAAAVAAIMGGGEEVSLENDS